MKNRKLTSYLDEIETAYLTATKEYESVLNDMEEAKKAISSVISNRDLTAEAKLRRTRANDEYMFDLEKKRVSIMNDFNRVVADVRGKAEAERRSIYAPNPEDIDMKTVELLKSGVLTEKEILEMTASYKAVGNNAMYRYCGSYLNPESKDLDTRTMAFDSKKAYTRPDMDVIDTYIELCQRFYTKSDLMVHDVYKGRMNDLRAEVYQSAQDSESETDAD